MACRGRGRGNPLCGRRALSAGTGLSRRRSAGASRAALSQGENALSCEDLPVPCLEVPLVCVPCLEPATVTLLRAWLGPACIPQ